AEGLPELGDDPAGRYRPIRQHRGLTAQIHVRARAGRVGEAGGLAQLGRVDAVDLHVSLLLGCGQNRRSASMLRTHPRSAATRSRSRAEGTVPVPSCMRDSGPETATEAMDAAPGRVSAIATA